MSYTIMVIDDEQMILDMLRISLNGAVSSNHSKK